MSETSFSRGLRILEAVMDRGEVSAYDLSRDLQIPISTTYRFLSTLRDRGLIRETDGRFTIGPRLASRGVALPTRTELRRLSRPTLEELAERCGETALIAVRVADQGLCLDQVESRHPVRLVFTIGQRLPLYAGATTRVLLAFAPSSIVDQVISDAAAVTDATPLGDDLRARLARTRQSGVATSRSELMSHAIAIAVPVLAGDECVCSLAVAAPDHRAEASAQRQIKALLLAARRDLEALL